MAFTRPEQKRFESAQNKGVAAGVGAGLFAGKAPGAARAGFKLSRGLGSTPFKAAGSGARAAGSAVAGKNPLSFGGAAVGGLAGGTGAGGVSALRIKRERKAKVGVRKNMGVSAFGVDHGEVSKALPGKKKIGYLKPRTVVDATGQLGPTGAKVVGSGISKADNQARNAGLFGATVGPASGLYGAAKAKPGRKAAVGGRVAGRTVATGLGGSTAGTLGGLAVTRGRSPAGVHVGGRIGAVAGSAHGGYTGMKNAKKRGDLKRLGR